MDNKPRQKDQSTSWKEENEKMTNPNRRQEEDQEEKAPKGQDEAEEA